MKVASVVVASTYAERLYGVLMSARPGGAPTDAMKTLGSSSLAWNVTDEEVAVAAGGTVRIIVLL